MSDESIDVLFFPEEVTINDPLYEPLKLQTFSSCKHINWMKTFSHKSFGLAPSLLYDIEKIKLIADNISYKYTVKSNHNNEIQCRAKILSLYYYPYIQSLFKHYCYLIDHLECDQMLEITKISDLEVFKKKSIQLNNSFQNFKLLRNIILPLYKEMTDEYLALLHGENIFIGDNFHKNSNSLFHDIFKKQYDPYSAFTIPHTISDEDLIERLEKIIKTEIEPSNEILIQEFVNIIKMEIKSPSDSDELIQKLTQRIKSELNVSENAAEFFKKLVKYLSQCDSDYENSIYVFENITNTINYSRNISLILQIIVDKVKNSKWRKQILKIIEDNIENVENNGQIFLIIINNITVLEWKEQIIQKIDENIKDKKKDKKDTYNKDKGNIKKIIDDNIKDKKDKEEILQIIRETLINSSINELKLEIKLETPLYNQIKVLQTEKIDTYNFNLFLEQKIKEIIPKKPEHYFLKLLSKELSVETIFYFDGFLYIYDLYSDPLKKELNYHNYSQISDYLKFNTQIIVQCPTCNLKTILSEHNKTYDLKNALLKTFEMRRSKWLLMSGFLHHFYRGATHTRLSHQIGTLIAAINTFNLINVNISKEITISFGNYLYITHSTFEFILSQVLHDIGHAPMSHVLENNPFLKYDHEEVTLNLINGKNESGNVNYYQSQYHYLKMRYINEYCDLYKKYTNSNQIKGESLEFFLNQINSVISAEIIDVQKVLENFGINIEKVVDILKDINETKKKDIQSDLKFFDIFHSMNYRDVCILHTFLHSSIDIDRIDHVKRDSTMSGVSLYNLKLNSLLSSILIIFPEGLLYKKIRSPETPDFIKGSPYIMISETGLKYFLDLLMTRKIIYREVLFSDQNNWINGVLNQMTGYAIKYQPHLPQLLPFITDQVIFHLYSHKLLNHIDIKKFNRLIQGREGYDLYGEPIRYKFNKKSLSRDVIKKIYHFFEEKNKMKYNFLQVPGIIFYTNIVIGEENNKENEYIEDSSSTNEKPWEDIFVLGKRWGDKYLTLSYLTDINETKNIKFKEKWGRPVENEVKNIFYIWANSLAIFEKHDNCNKKTGLNQFKSDKYRIKEIIHGLMNEMIQYVQKEFPNSINCGDFTEINSIENSSNMNIPKMEEADNE